MTTTPLISRYHTTPGMQTLFGTLLPSVSFYLKLTATIFAAASSAKNGRYNDAAWAASSGKVLTSLEQSGVGFDVSGLEHISGLNEPGVIIGNHMSMMETLVLPNLILPFTQATFVIKESLLDYPVFKHIMRSRNPVAVTRSNPRADLKTVMTEGVERVKNNISVIVFPQTTRSTEFDMKSFSSIGIKLAKRAGCPVIPLALKTDAWTNGSLLKDFGRLSPQKEARFAFGEPLHVQGKGQEEHLQVMRFIEDKLNSWKDTA
ncbi:MAG: lysophospholipid acyltransferase family protein [Thermodesulfobacteriota bacterium]